MKPVAFDYVKASTVTNAIEALASANGGGKLIAGGQSLGPMLNLRLVQPQILIDIAGIPELADISEGQDHVRIGAAVTAANIEDGRIPLQAVPILPRIAGGIAYRAVRNRGTIGGSLCHADPAADWLVTLTALGAVLQIRDSRGTTRQVALEDFMAAAFETMLTDTEMLVSVTIPAISRTSRFGYGKISRKLGKFAMANAVVLFDRERNTFRAVIGATDGRPIIVKDARTILGDRPDEGTLRLDERLVSSLLAESGLVGARSQHLHLTALRQAASEAFIQ